MNNQTYCTKCLTQLHESETTCYNCGEAVNLIAPEQPEEDQKEYDVAISKMIFIAVIGVAAAVLAWLGL